MTQNLLLTLCWSWTGLGILVFFVLLKVKAPFGRHTSTHWGPMINNQLAWFLMELPSFLLMFYFTISNDHLFSSWIWLLCFAWLLHYFHRSMIYPLRIKATSKKMPLLIMGFAIVFNLINASVNGYFFKLFSSPTDYQNEWLQSLHFKLGLFLFIVGLIINRISDYQLIKLRKPGDESYQIPKGFLFEKISSPNLFGEMVQWTGFAVMAWNLPTFSFCIWTFANLFPRALSHHQWYLKQFPDYPQKRKAVIPFVV